jgi:hypothetical protein
MLPRRDELSIVLVRVTQAERPLKRYILMDKRKEKEMRRDQILVSLLMIYWSPAKQSRADSWLV